MLVASCFPPYSLVRGKHAKAWNITASLIPLPVEIFLLCNHHSFFPRELIAKRMHWSSTPSSHCRLWERFQQISNVTRYFLCYYNKGDVLAFFSYESFLEKLHDTPEVIRLLLHSILLLKPGCTFFSVSTFAIIITFWWFFSLSYRYWHNQGLTVDCIVVTRILVISGTW